MPRPPNEPKGAINGFAMDCMGQFRLGYYFVVQSIHHIENGKIRRVEMIGPSVTYHLSVADGRAG